MNAALIFLSLFAMLAAGMPIGFAMGVSGVFGLWLVGGFDSIVGVVSTAPYSVASHYELLSIPLFILMAQFVIISKIGDELYECAVVWIGRIRGGLAIAAAMTGAGIGAVSGSSVASVAMLSSTSLPTMLKAGYEPKLAGGAVAISGTLAMLIPPSGALIIFGLLSEESIGKLLVAGVVPGIVVTLVIAATVWVLVKLDPSRAPVTRSYTMREKFASLRSTGPMLLLMLLVTGLIYLGVATPTESASLGAFGSFLIACSRGKMTFALTRQAIANAARTSAMITIIILGAQVFGYALVLTQATQAIVEFITQIPASRYVILALVLGLLIILGCFLDQVAILILTVPILVPAMKALGFDPIWFGVMVVVTAEIGMITPPVGLNAFMVARFTGRPVSEVFAGIWPHFYAHILILVLFTVFPGLILWLPSTMK